MKESARQSKEARGILLGDTIKPFMVIRNSLGIRKPDKPRSAASCQPESQATVHLPLQAGSKEISIVVADRFGGWAIMGSVPDMTGLRIGN